MDSSGLGLVPATRFCIDDTKGLDSIEIGKCPN
jgi:hypothetical protein